MHVFQQWVPEYPERTHAADTRRTYILHTERYPANLWIRTPAHNVVLPMGLLACGRYLLSYIYDGGNKFQCIFETEFLIDFVNFISNLKFAVLWFSLDSDDLHKKNSKNGFLCLIEILTHAPIR